MITEDYVSFETAKLLKEKGFNFCCEFQYINCSSEHPFLTDIRDDVGCYYKNSEIGQDEYSAPTIQMAMKWLREIHNIHIVIKVIIRTYGDTEYYYELYSTKNKSLCVVCDIYKGESWDSSEEACEAAIQYCLKELIY